jgi:hypothetical protein
MCQEALRECQIISWLLPGRTEDKCQSLQSGLRMPTPIYMNQEPSEYITKVLTSQTGRSLTKLLDLLKGQCGVCLKY